MSSFRSHGSYWYTDTKKTTSVLEKKHIGLGLLCVGLHSVQACALQASKQASIFICQLNGNGNIISMNNIQGQTARKAHKAQHCWPPCKKIILNLKKKQTNMCTVQEYK